MRLSETDPVRQLSEALRATGAGAEGRLSREDAPAVGVMEAVMMAQQQLLATWEGCFARALQAGDPGPDHAALRYDALSRRQGGGGGRGGFGRGGVDDDDDAGEPWRSLLSPDERWLVCTYELDSHGRMCAQHHGLLRRLSSSAEVLLSVRDALKATLPSHYRWARAATHLLLGHCWIKWRLLPADWAESLNGGRSRQALRWQGRATGGGQGGGGRGALLEAEIFELDGLSHKAQVVMPLPLPLSPHQCFRLSSLLSPLSSLLSPLLSSPLL